MLITPDVTQSEGVSVNQVEIKGQLVTVCEMNFSEGMDKKGHNGYRLLCEIYKGVYLQAQTDFAVEDALKRIYVTNTPRVLTPEEFEKIHLEDLLIVMVFRDNHIAGWGFYHPMHVDEEERIVNVGGIVLPEYQYRGIGKYIFQRLIESFLEDNELQRALFTSLEKNARSIKTIHRALARFSSFGIIQRVRQEIEGYQYICYVLNKYRYEEA